VDWAKDGLEQSKRLGRSKYESRVLTTRGRAFVALGQAQNGLDDLRQSVVLARTLGDPALLLSAATALLSIEGDDDSLITEAKETARQISLALPNEHMRALFERAEPLGLLALTADGRTRLRYPAGLTWREVEVLRLIAGGSSNREVAAQLVLSLRTVERHITNIYAKIGARGRADATSYALRNSLS
jgi:DNA-binding NarL/FixJ family response regulator